MVCSLLDGNQKSFSQLESSLTIAGSAPRSMSHFNIFLYSSKGLPKVLPARQTQMRGGHLRFGFSVLMNSNSGGHVA